MKRFLFGFILISLFSSPVLAAGYSCPAYMKYTSCSTGYYMTNGGAYNGTPVSGNTCTTCPAGYTCAGGTANMVASTRSCAAGTYWNGSACANCGGDAYYCPGFSNISNPGSGYGRNGVSAGYYSTGGGATTRTGQAQCTAGSYCSAGVKYTCAAGTYSGAGAGACTACSGATQFQDATGQSGCKAVSTGYYKSSNAVQALCPAGYQVGAGAANQASCIGSFSKSGSQLAPALPANCASITATGACTPGTCTYQQNYAGTITSNCTPTNCTKPVTGVTSNANYYANASSCTACPAGYPGSDAGNSGGITKCFSSSKSRAWSGGQTACALPANCATVSCNACSVGACAYVAYANSAGTADGTIKSGCSTNSAACQQTVGGVTANGGAYINGTACSACPSGYASGAGASSQSGCSGSVDAGKYVATAGGASTACAAGTFKAAHRVNYGATSSCAACTGTTYSGAGAASCAACPAGYTANTASNKTAAAQCQINVGAGQYMATAGSGGSVACAAGTSKAAHTLNYGATSACAACTGATYSEAGAASCAACPSGYTANTASNKTAVAQCQISCAAGTRVVNPETACTTPSGGWFTAAHLINYRQISPVNFCTTGFISSGTTAAAHDAMSDCVKTVAAGKYIPATTAQGRYVRIGSSGSTANSGHHVVEVQAFSSSNATGANMLAGKNALSASRLPGGATDGSWFRNDYTECSGSPGCVWDIGSVVTIGSIKFALFTDGRTYNNVTIAVSNDNINWTTVLGPIEILTQVIETSVGDIVVVSSSDTTCAAGTANPSQSVALGSTSSCAACTGTTYSGVGAASCAACPAGYTANTASNKTAAAQCQINVGGGQYMATAGSGGSVACAAGTSKPAHTVNYGATSACAACTGTTYSGVGAASCAACPAGYDANTASNKTAAAQCQINVGGGQYIATANAGANTCPAGSYCPGAIVNYGNTGIIMTCSAGTFSTVGSTGCSTCPVGSYSTSSAGVCTACQGGLTTSAAGQSSCNATCSNKNDYASNWAAVTWTNNSVSNLCALLGCSGGYYVNTNACVVAGAGYWSASGSGARTACDAGTTTIGSGAGADEAADCGRRLHIGDSILYLRSAKKTTPSLNVGVNGTIYYGNMTPGSSKGALRVNYGGTTYSVYDDSM